MIIYVDIDGTITKPEKLRSYLDSEPVKECIDKINKLYDQGHTIVYWTGRGNTTGIDWSAITEMQLKLWGCKHHELKMGQKPPYDLLIDDKSKRIEEI
jgi:histidinol phosphatase-like enzyme